MQIVLLIHSLYDKSSVCKVIHSWYGPTYVVLCGLHSHDYGFGLLVVWRNENDMYVVTVLALWKAIL